ncbi:MAG: 50S ribosomal protein L29 [Pseudomonadota bacterium]|nr:50S ribosomal protein L29 [Pseudomonadota bacterium]
MKAKDFRAKNKDELQTELHSSLRELFNLRMQSELSEGFKTHQFKQVRRNIARLKTILRERENG